MTHELNGRRVTVMGLGRFGGGVGVARWLAAQGADVLVTDIEPADKLASSVEQLRALLDSGMVSLRLGGHHISDFTDTDLVVANPAVPKPWDNRFLRATGAAGVPITTEIRLLAERLPRRGRVIGVTGTAGKSTTSAMIAHILRDAHGEARVHFGGNIGGSLLGSLDRLHPDDWIVLELSSAQLHWLGADAGYRGAPGWAPGIGVITNIAPNHLDWHGEMVHYAASKAQILERLEDRDIGIAGPGVTRHLPGVDRLRPVRLADRSLAHGSALRLPGAHNRANASMAIQACAAAGIDQDAARGALASFAGLPHRLQLVGVCGPRGGVRAFNDSKCTTPEACALAVAAFDEPGECGSERVYLICGGYDKKIDLAPMIDAASRCAGVYTIGDTGPEIARRVLDRCGRAQECGTLERAVLTALADATGGECVLLLSPGCASWDQFTNYEARGHQFAAMVRDHAEGASNTIVTCEP